MEEQKKQKSEAAVILDKEIFEHTILGSKKLELKISKPLNNLALNFLSEFSFF